MNRKRTQPSAPDDPFAPGVYLTDGSSLFNIVGELPHEPSLRLVEDCSTLEILMVHVDGLRSPTVRRVHAAGSEELAGEGRLLGVGGTNPASADPGSLARTGHR